MIFSFVGSEMQNNWRTVVAKNLNWSSRVEDAENVCWPWYIFVQVNVKIGHLLKMMGKDSWKEENLIIHSKKIN